MTIAHIDEVRLETDTVFRFGYLCDFIGFGEDDMDAIHAAAPLLGFVATAISRTLRTLGLDRETESRTLLAFEKLRWIQNDLITRHYASVT